VNRLPLQVVPAALLALLSTAVTLAVRLALDGPLGGRPTLVIFTVPIMFSAYVGGLRAGLLATGLSYLAAAYWLLPPMYSFVIASAVDRWQLFFVVLAGVVISVLNEALHRARHRADRAAEALRTAAALQSAIFDSANFCSIATDAKGVIQIFNVGAERLLGYRAAEAVNKLTPADLADPLEMATRAQALSQEFGTPITPGLQTLTYKAARGLAYVYEPTLIRKDGSRLPAVVSVAALRDPQGEITGYLLIGTDNTVRRQLEVERQRSEAAVRDSEQTLRKVIDERVRADEALLQASALQNAIFNSANFSSIATDARGVIQIFNVGAERMLGYAAADVVNRITPADISDPQEVIARAAALSLELGTTIAPGFEALVFKASRSIVDIYELTYVRKDGSRFPAVVSVTALRDAGETIIGYLLIGTDNTAAKAARLAAAQVQASEARYRTLFEYAPDGILIADAAGRYLDANPSMCRMLGYARDDLIGLESANVVALSKAEHVGPTLTEIEFHAEHHREWTFRRRDGNTFAARVLATQMPGGNVLAMVHDITERKQVEASLREATHKAEEANRAKSDFLANTSHEIRTPMNAVMGLSYLLGQTTLDAPQRTLLAKVELASKSLLGVLNNVLDLAKIEADELIVERAPFSLHRLLQALDDLMALQAKAKAIAFEIDVEPGLPAVLEGDATRLAQVLTNLLSNAIKFTDRGRVGLRVRRLAATAPQVRLCFEVQDSGIGIAADVQARLFEPFVQADASITRRFGGTGLGLSIVRHLVQLMGGEVRLQSWAGVGSEFTVTLDFADVTALSPVSTAALNPLQAAPRPADGRALAGVRVLVVDDSDINLEVTQRILQLAGARVGLAASGEQALGLLRGHPDAFDIVLMDVQMPGLDGHDATRRIRGELALTALPVIALTAGALSSERQKALDAGMDDYIVKPFEAEALVRTVLRHVQRAEGVAPAAVEAANESPNESPNEAANGAASDALPPALPWQEIDGVDAADARLRFGGDFVLFCSLLKRMLAEFAGAALVVPQPASTSERAWLGGRLHKLRGVAGLLGATSVQEAAERAEAACPTAAAGAGASGAAGALGDADPAPTLLAALAVLAEQLQRLQRDAAPVLAAAEAAAEAAAQLALRHGSGGLTPQALRDFMSLLRTQSLSALDRFGELTPLLTRQLGADRFQTLRTHMEVLQFSEAAELLAHDGSDAA
jgi:PAS domain S-box-containing protein